MRFAAVAIFWPSRLVINVVAQKITKVFLISVVTERFNTSSLAAVAVDLSHTTLTRRYVVMVKSIAKKADLAVVVTEFITLLYLCAAMDEYSTNGAGHLAVDHATITVRANYAATVGSFPKCTVLHAVPQGRIVQTCRFAVTTRFTLVGTVFHVVEVTAIKQANKYVVLVEFYLRVVALHVVGR